MTSLIPLRSDLTDYAFEIDLTGVTFTLRLFWNYVNQVWYLGISAGDGTALSMSQPLLLGNFPGRREKDERMPKGAFAVIDTSAKGIEATKTDIGTRVLLYYFEPGETWIA